MNKKKGYEDQSREKVLTYRILYFFCLHLLCSVMLYNMLLEITLTQHFAQNQAWPLLSLVTKVGLVFHDDLLNTHSSIDRRHYELHNNESIIISTE